jgi:hypothetical protein
MANAWLFQNYREKQKIGDAAPLSVAWIFKGKRKTKKIGSKSLADKFSKQIEARLNLGEYHEDSKKIWPEFRKEVENYVTAKLKPSSLTEFLNALDKFEEIVQPYKLEDIAETDVNRFIVQRKQPGSTVSFYTLKKELTSIKRALGLAYKWKFIRERIDIEPMPSLKFLYQWL